MQLLLPLPNISSKSSPWGAAFAVAMARVRQAAIGRVMRGMVKAYKCVLILEDVAGCVIFATVVLAMEWK